MSAAQKHRLLRTTSLSGTSATDERVAAAVNNAVGSGKSWKTATADEIFRDVQAMYLALAGDRVRDALK